MVAPRWHHWAPRLLGACLFLYYALACFRVPWGWDLLRQAAAIQSFLSDFARPAHEAMSDPQSGPYGSVLHSPFNLILAALARLLGVSPYRSLQLQGVFALGLYGYAVRYYLRSVSWSPQSALPWAAFLLLNLFFRETIHGWSSETDFFTLTVLQAYPSFLAWSLVFLALGLSHRASILKASLVQALILAFLLTSHPISGGWLTGLLVLQRFWLVSRLRHYRAFWALLAVPLGFGLALLWPYPPGLWGLFSYAGSPEASPLAAHPLSDMPVLYGLAGLLGLAWLTRRLRGPLSNVYHGELWLLWAGTVFGFFVLQRLGVSYGDRFILFQLGFLYLLLAEVAVGLYLGIATLSVPKPKLWIWAYVAVLVLSTGRAVVSQYRHHPERRLPSPWALWRRTPSHSLHQQRFAPVQDHLSRNDIVLMPSNAATYAVAELTGARVLLADTAFDHPEYLARAADLKRFLAATSSDTLPLDVLSRWGVTRIVHHVPVDPKNVAATQARCGPGFGTAALHLWRTEDCR